MPNNISTESTDPLPQPSIDQRLTRIESAIAELLTGQRRVLSELEIIKEDAKKRYVDLRERTEINSDKLSVVQRELNQIAKDIRNPAFS
ncbi:MAG: hypothetical protein M3X11_04810 [Acidobacteriota bacterium]|nr:hypothetical protein [Acidobacteriota bacterium]